MHTLRRPVRKVRTVLPHVSAVRHQPSHVQETTGEAGQEGRWVGGCSYFLFSFHRCIATISPYEFEFVCSRGMGDPSQSSETSSPGGTRHTLSRCRKTGKESHRRPSIGTSALPVVKAGHCSVCKLTALQCFESAQPHSPLHSFRCWPLLWPGLRAQGMRLFIELCVCFFNGEPCIHH